MYCKDISGYFRDEITICDYCLATVRKKESLTNLSFTQHIKYHLLGKLGWIIWHYYIKMNIDLLPFFQCSNTSFTFLCCITVCFKSVCTNSKSLLHKWELFDFWCWKSFRPEGSEVSASSSEPRKRWDQRALLLQKTLRDTSVSACVRAEACSVLVILWRCLPAVSPSGGWLLILLHFLFSKMKTVQPSHNNLGCLWEKSFRTLYSWREVKCKWSGCLVTTAKKHGWVVKRPLSL